MSEVSMNMNAVLAKDEERRRLNAQMEAFVARGGKPITEPPNRYDHTRRAPKPMRIVEREQEEAGKGEATPDAG